MVLDHHTADPSSERFCCAIVSRRKERREEERRRWIMAQPTSSALRALALEYKSLQEEPVEGFRVKLVNEDNMFEWEVAIFGPPDTLYQGGYFKVQCVCVYVSVCCVQVCVCVLCCLRCISFSLSLSLACNVCSARVYLRKRERESNGVCEQRYRRLYYRTIRARHRPVRSWLCRNTMQRVAVASSCSVASPCASSCARSVPFPRRAE